jgi:hypothetical protein
MMKLQIPHDLTRAQACALLALLDMLIEALIEAHHQTCRTYRISPHQDDEEIPF